MYAEAEEMTPHPYKFSCSTYPSSVLNLAKSEREVEQQHEALSQYTASSLVQSEYPSTFANSYTMVSLPVHGFWDANGDNGEEAEEYINPDIEEVRRETISAVISS
jgi:hypothetical protein